MKRAKHKLLKKRLKERPTLTLSWLAVPKKLTPNNKLRIAARSVAREVDKHFIENVWDLNFSLLVEKIFLLANGHLLENYLLAELYKRRKYILTTDKHGSLVVRKVK